MKPIFIGFVLMALLCAVGSVSGADDTQVVSASAAPFTATITAPIDVSGWSLTRGIDNDQYLGYVEISSSAPPSWDMKLTVSADTSLWVFTQPLQITTNNDAPPTGWVALVNGMTLIEQDVSATPIQVPINIRQFVASDQAPGAYTLTLTYSLTVSNPS